MIEAENDIQLASSWDTVWRTLTDFKHYKAWHPYNRIEGAAELGSKIDYTYFSTLIGPRSLHIPGRITRLEPGRILEWRVGFRFVFIFTETYTLEPANYGTHLVHRIEYRGLGATFNRKRAGGHARTLISKIDAALARYLAPSAARPRLGKPKMAGSKSRKR
ncbi:MAG: hypothetical protein B7Z08_02300 [Sphingomonadales bacterium 32-68-7]|nr:MAG: hypothetical protein B7Z33_03075 [Sphingomonadales bacterium 12-68-11]OYX10078.1 MAG: hypothetical protein B7Z08_02300 [Sphingomonadales bacterium 32-68-7]